MGAAMTPALRIALPVVLVVVGLASARPGASEGPAPRADGGAHYRLSDTGSGGRELATAARSAGFTFAPGTSPSDRASFAGAVAAAQPQAQRLVATVDGLTDVTFAPAGPGAVGLTQSDGSGRYRVTIDLAGVTARHGQRGISRVVLHELAHVLDLAVVPDALRTTLDAGIPPCPAGLPRAECAAPEERFAEAFAKWATGDIGLDLYLGYRVPPPFPLASWGAPLAALAGA